MTHSSEKKPMSTTSKVLIGTGIGCGCLTFLGIPVAILMAIALPSFLNQANKAKQSEAKQYVGTMVRSEQAYFLENQQFIEDPVKLGIPSDAMNSLNYTYSVKVLKGQNQSMAVVQAIPKATRKGMLKSYVGAVRAVGKPQDATSEAIVCMTPEPSGVAVPFSLSAKPTEPLDCPKGMVALP
jgi:type IV pilus assembly protein PilA